VPVTAIDGCEVDDLGPLSVLLCVDHDSLTGLKVTLMVSRRDLPPTLVALPHL
jgi:hypothetical protein